MGNKRNLILVIIAVVLAGLMYLQFRTWRNFDWAIFWSQTRKLSLFHILAGTVLIYLAYVMRAIRWKIFLRPVRPNASAWGLVAPTIIGFASLAVLGRPGELVRPYLIGRKEKLTLSSQIGVWTVERIFDVGAFTLLLVSAIFLTQSMAALPYSGAFRKAGVLLIFGSIAATISALAVHWKGEAFADWISRKFSRRPSDLGHTLALRIREFRSGLNTIHGVVSFLQLTAVSVAMWYTIALAYRQVTQAYATPLLDIPVSQLYLLMASSMAGSVIALPGVGGGSQLATMGVLDKVFGVPHELAFSCGLMLWIVSFVSAIPIGLFLAHRERLSLRALSQEVAQEETSTAA
jgi:uncharacterized protein (TIRG00374 family)